VPFICHRRHSRRVDRDQTELSRDEEPVRGYEEDDGEQADGYVYLPLTLRPS